MNIREFEHGQDMLKLESIGQSIKRLTLTSPSEGSVEEIFIEPGEAVQALVPVIINHISSAIEAPNWH